MIIQLAALVLSALLQPTTAPSVREDHFEKTITKKLDLPYLVYLPCDYEKAGERAKKWPLIVFLHGSGECGHDLSRLKGRGPAQMFLEHPELPFMMVTPLAASELDWWQPESLNPMLDEVIQKYDVDPDRVYLTGVSMGAYGVWDWACHNPERFAAIAPLAGEGNDDFAARLKHVPVWAFHGALDTAVSLAEEERMVNAVNKAGGDAKLTMYPDGKHNIWPRTYTNPDLYEWFLKHTRWKADHQPSTTPQR